MSKKILRIAIAIAVLAVAVVIYFLFSPEESDFFPQCPFHYLTGLDCPGCGSQRVIHHLLHLQIGKAFFNNPLLVTAIPYLIIGIYFEYFGGKLKYPKVRQILFGKKATIVVFIIVVTYWIGRNVVKYWLLA